MGVKSRLGIVGQRFSSSGCHTNGARFALAQFVAEAVSCSVMDRRQHPDETIYTAVRLPERYALLGLHLDRRH